MNILFILYMLTRVIQFEGLFLSLPCVVSLIYGEKAGVSYAIVMAVCLLIGGVGSLLKPKNTVFYAREGYVIVALSWIVLSAIGAIPLFACGDIPHYSDALFEIISGFTTTGASILNNVEGLNHCSLIWRCFSNWIGGMGVLVFIMALLPLGGSYNLHIMRAESPGPSVDKLVPKVSDSAKVLYCIYIGLTLMEMITLLIQGMPLFDSVNAALATAGTGGFGIKNDSFASYTAGMQITVTVFMILFGVNFNVYFLLIHGFRKTLTHKVSLKESTITDAIRFEEVWWYFLVILIGAGVCIWQTAGMYDTIGESIRHSFFTVGSMISTTGFATADFDLWSAPAKIVIIFLMAIGACAGSTGGGIKISRIIIWVKSLGKEINTFLHPHLVKKTGFNGRKVEHEVVRGINVFIVAYVCIFAVSLFIISLDGYDFETSFTSVLSAMSNIGPGLGKVGPTCNFAEYSYLSKYVLMFDMLAGRLELFPMLILLTPATWFKK